MARCRCFCSDRNVRSGRGGQNASISGHSRKLHIEIRKWELTEHNSDCAGCHGEGILEGFTDGIVTVHRDAAEMENGRGAEVDVERVPEVTGDLVEEPATVIQRLTGIEAHGTDSDERVGEGKGDDKVVGPCPELPVPPNGHYHQGVPQNGREDDAHENDEQSDPEQHHLEPGK